MKNQNDNEEQSQRGLSLHILSQHRTAIYGFSILWIVFFHGATINGCDFAFGKKIFLPLKLFIQCGNVGVDIFLFLSGICLYYSFTKNSNLYEFLKKRVLRLIIPVLLIDGIYWFFYYGIASGQYMQVINRIFLLQFWETGDQTIWFVSCILVLYVLYPYIYSFLFHSKKNIWLRGCFLLGITYVAIYSFMKINPNLYNQVEIAITRFPVFFLGCICGKSVYEKKKMPFWTIWFPILGAILFHYIRYLQVLKGYKLRFFYLIGGISMTFVLALIFKGLDRVSKHKSKILWFFNFIGEISLELYLSHMILVRIYLSSPYGVYGSKFDFILIVALSILVAFLVSKIANKIRSKIFMMERRKYQDE